MGIEHPKTFAEEYPEAAPYLQYKQAEFMKDGGVCGGQKGHLMLFSASDISECRVAARERDHEYNKARNRSFRQRHLTHYIRGVRMNEGRFEEFIENQDGKLINCLDLGGGDGIAFAEMMQTGLFNQKSSFCITQELSQPSVIKPSHHIVMDAMDLQPKQGFDLVTSICGLVLYHPLNYIPGVAKLPGLFHALQFVRDGGFLMTDDLPSYVIPDLLSNLGVVEVWRPYTYILKRLRRPTLQDYVKIYSALRKR